MDWIDRAFGIRESIAQAEKKLDSRVPDYWESLVAAMKESVDAYRTKETYGRYEYHDKNHHQFVIHCLQDTPIRDTESKKAVVQLDRAKRAISASYKDTAAREKPLSLNGMLSLNEEGEVVLSVGPKSDMKTEAASEVLLIPFLFPDLLGHPDLPQYLPS